jgi:hypothetical protein
MNGFGAWSTDYNVRYQFPPNCGSFNPTTELTFGEADRKKINNTGNIKSHTVMLQPLALAQ